MTVAEVIEKLKTFPPDAKVVVSSCSEWCAVESIDTLEGRDMGGWISTRYPGQSVALPQVTAVAIS